MISSREEKTTEKESHMSLHSSLLCDIVPLNADEAVLVLNSAGDPFVPYAFRQLQGGMITLAEDNIAHWHTAHQALDLDPPSIHTKQESVLPHVQHVAFHNALQQQMGNRYDLAVMNLRYQPANAWIHYGIRLASVALKPGGYFYLTGAKEKGILTMAKHMHVMFGNSETLTISKGQRVVSAQKPASVVDRSHEESENDLSTHIFAGSKLDEGTRLLLETLDIHKTDVALDLGCGAGFIGLHIAGLAHRGHVTMVDVSLAAIAASQRAIELRNLHNARALPSDVTQAIRNKRFDLIATNPPFHQEGLQTIRLAERFIHESANLLKPEGRFYLVANRFLKYETTMTRCFLSTHEAGGNNRYKVLCGRIS
jgi:16S rRNA (guanine1207-N2)-methyltransferase